MPFRFRLGFSGVDTADLEVLTNAGWSSYRQQEGKAEGAKFCRKDPTNLLFAHLKALPVMEICLNNLRKC